MQLLKLSRLVNWVVLQWKEIHKLANSLKGPDNSSYSSLLFLFYNSLKMGHYKNRQARDWPAGHSMPIPALEVFEKCKDHETGSLLAKATDPLENIMR